MSKAAPHIRGAREALAAGQITQAIEHLNLALTSATAADAPMLAALGAQLMKAKQFAAAQQALDAAIQMGAAPWEAYGNAAHLNAQAGDLKRAIALLETAFARQPDQPILLKRLVAYAEAVQDFAKAAQALEQLIRMGAADASDLLKAPLLHRLAGDLAAAERLLSYADHHLTDKSRLFPIAVELASAAQDWPLLISRAQLWLDHEPKSAAAREALARGFLENGDLDQAASTFAPIVSRGTPKPEQSLTYGRICLGAQRFDEAEVHLSAAAKALPQSSEALTALARLRTLQGDPVTGERLCREAIALGGDSARALAQLATTLRGKISADDKRQMETAFAASEANAQVKAALAFGLGDAHLRSSDAETSLSWYRRGNALRRDDAVKTGDGFDADDLHRHMSLLHRTVATLAPTLASPPDEDEPSLVFVVGMPRSGTTLVEAILDAHPSAVGFGERAQGPTLLDRFVHAAQADQATDIAALVSSKHTEWRAQYLAGLEAARGAGQAVIDKMPGNALAIPLLARLFPRSRFLLLWRRPFDVAISIYRHQFPKAYRWSHDLDDIAVYFEAWATLMADYRAAYRDRINVIDYEKLVTDPDREMRALISAAGLPWDDACTHFHQRERTVATFSSLQVRQPISQKASDGGGAFRTLLETYAETLDQRVTAAFSR